MPQIEHRVTRSAKMKLRVTSTHPQADHVVPSRRKQGIRRKAQDSSSYMLDKYLDSEVITLSAVNSINGGIYFSGLSSCLMHSWGLKFYVIKKCTWHFVLKLHCIIICYFLGS